MSTSKKALKSSQLMIHYIKASSAVYNHRPYVTVPQSVVLSKHDKKLEKQHIRQKDYAHRLLAHLKKWVLGKKWKTLPVHLFVSEWALDLYKKEIGDRSFNYINENDEMFKILVVQEFEVLKYHRHSGNTDYQKSVEDMKPMLTDDWLKIQDERTGKMVHNAAVRMYEDVYCERITL